MGLDRGRAGEQALARALPGLPSAALHMVLGPAFSLNQPSSSSSLPLRQPSSQAPFFSSSLHSQAAFLSESLRCKTVACQSAAEQYHTRDSIVCSRAVHQAFTAFCKLGSNNCICYRMHDPEHKEDTLYLSVLKLQIPRIVCHYTSSGEPMITSLQS